MINYSELKNYNDDNFNNSNRSMKFKGYTYYSKLKKYDVANWDGVNTSIYFSGCTHNCKGCFNKEAKLFNSGYIFDDHAFKTVIEYVSDKNVKGLCVLGGEPFQQDLDVLKDLFLTVKLHTNKPIHVWTGYTFEELWSDPKIRLIISGYVDTIIDGKFDLSKKDINLKHKGSSNQRVIDVKQTLITGKISLVRE